MEEFKNKVEKPNNEWNVLMNHEQYTLQFDGLNIRIDDGVFTPDPTITYTPSMILDNLPELEGKKVADVGTGTGVIGIVSANRGADVIATDISTLAIENAEFNATQNNLEDKMRVVHTSLLDGVEDTFDYVFANIPMDAGVWSKEGIDVDSTSEKFFKDVREKLNDGGKVYVPWGSFAEEARIAAEGLMKKEGFNFTVSSKKLLGYIWYLYVLSID